MGNRHRTVKFLRVLAIYISILLGVGVLYAPSSESADIMQVPSGQQVFASCAKVLPYLNTDPSLANPVGVGTVAVGGNAFDLKIGLNPFSGPVDIYFGLQDDNGNLYILHSDGSLEPFAKGLVPWKSNVDSGLSWDITQAISGSAEIPASSIPPGAYTLYLVVTPTGDPGSYYLWQTSFSSTYPFVVSPSCIDLGGGSSSQASIAFVNTSANPFSYQGKSQTSAGDTPSSYNISNNSCATNELNSGSWCSMDVTFTPGTSGKMIATFARADSATGTEVNIPIVFQSEVSSPGTCSLTISSTSKTFPASGGTGSFSVTAGSGCSWTATSSDSSWLHVTSGSSSAGNAVDYSVDQNTGTSTRTATISVGDQTFTVTQDASASSSSCQNPAVSPISVSAGSGGGTYSVNVTTAAGCSWGANVSLFSAAWITITTGKSYTGSATVRFTVAASSGSRTGYLTVDGKSITVSQQGSGCSYSVSPGSKTLGTSATSGSLTITAGANCPWTVQSSDSSWLTVTSSASGTGNGTVSYSVAADTTSVKRTASIFVQQAPGTANLTVTQDPGASGCNYSLSPYSASVAVSGVSGRFSVMAGSGCTWTATSNNSSWLHVTSGSSGSGNGAVSYTVDANTGGTRTGTIVVADQTFTVTESGTAPPPTSGSISYSSLTVNDPKGWTSSGNGPNAMSFYRVTVPAGDSTLQIGLAGEVPQAWNNDMLVSDTDFGSASNALSLYNNFMQQYGYNGPETYALEYSGAHYWFKFASNSESENVTVNNAAGTYYIMVYNTTQNGSLWLIEANAF